MYVQVIKGKTSDAQGLRTQLDRWRSDLKPGAVGNVGSTVGIADDGTFFVIARFADAKSAAANAGRTEQTAWWNDTTKYIDGEPSFRESSDVSLLFDGGSDAATFVQVMEGTVADRAKAEEVESPEMLEQLRAARPDLLGAQRIWFDGGKYVEIAYFTSEADARKNEASAEFTQSEGDFAAAFGEMTFVDLRDPILDTA